MRGWLRAVIGTVVVGLGTLGTGGAWAVSPPVSGQDGAGTEESAAVYAKAAAVIADYIKVKSTAALGPDPETTPANHGLPAGTLRLDAGSWPAASGTVLRTAGAALSPADIRGTAVSGAEPTGPAGLAGPAAGRPAAQALKADLPGTKSTKSAGAQGAGAKPVPGGSAGYERPQQRTVYLTFDDGPSANTGKVLDILKKNGIKASFFMVGRHVEENPKLVRRVKAEGHTIGNHSYNHVYKEIYGDFGQFVAQVGKTEAALAKHGIVTPFLRAPGGTYTNFDQGYFDAVRKAGYVIVDWNVDSGDSKRVGVPASEIVSAVRQSKLGHELTVLMHDGTGHGETVEALQEIIDYYKNRGYRFAPLTERVEPVVFPVAASIKWTRPAPTAAQVAELVRQAPAEWRAAAGAGKEAALAQSGPEGSAGQAAGAGQSQNAGQSAVITKGPQGAKGADVAEPGKEAEAGAAANAAKPGTGASETAIAGKGRIAGALPDGGTGDGKSPGTLQPQLAVRALGQTVVFGYGEYALRSDRWHVPLRKLVEGLGGQVAWNAAERTVTVTLGGSGDVVLTEGLYEWPSGTMNAPVHDIFKLLGLHIAAVKSEDGLREIWGNAS